MDATEGTKEIPYLFGQCKEGQVTFEEAVGRVTVEPC